MDVSPIVEMNLRFQLLRRSGTEPESPNVQQSSHFSETGVQFGKQLSKARQRFDTNDGLRQHTLTYNAEFFFLFGYFPFSFLCTFCPFFDNL